MAPDTELDSSCLAEARQESWAPGQLIYEYTHTPIGVYYIMSGQVNLTRLLEQGERKVIHILSAEQFFFEARFFYPQKQSMHAHALRPTRTAYFPRPVVERLIDSSRSFRRALLCSLASKTLYAGTEVVEQAYAPPEKRMLRAVRDLTLHQRYQNDEPAKLHITQAMLAEYVGLHPITVNRTLRRLEKAGYIELGRASIRILTLPEDFDVN